MTVLKKEKAQAHPAATAETADTGEKSQLERIAEHLVFLEKKLDTILEQMRNQAQQQQQRPPRPSFQGPGGSRPPYGQNRPYQGRPQGSHQGGYRPNNKYGGHFQGGNSYGNRPNGGRPDHGHGPRRDSRHSGSANYNR